MNTKQTVFFSPWKFKYFQKLLRETHQFKTLGENVKLPFRCFIMRFIAIAFSLMQSTLGEMQLNQINNVYTFTSDNSILCGVYFTKPYCITNDGVENNIWCMEFAFSFFGAFRIVGGWFCVYSIQLLPMISLRFLVSRSKNTQSNIVEMT